MKNWITGDLDFGVFTLVLFVWLLGSSLAGNHLEIQMRAKRLTLFVFVGLFVWHWIEWRPGDADTIVSILARSLVLSGLALGVTLIVMTVAGLIHETYIRPVINGWHERKLHWQQSREDDQKRRTEAFDRQQRETEWQSSAADREQARLAAAAKLQAEAEQLALAKHRREEARLGCMLLRDQYSTELGNRFTRDRLDDYFATYMTDTHLPEEVEARATQLKGMIEQALAASGATQKKQFRSLIEIAEYFQTLREDAAKSNFDRDIIESIIARYHTQENTAVAEFFKS